MNRAIGAALGVVRVTGVVQVVLGLLFWSGHQLNLVPLHMAVGLAFVLALWTLAALGAKRGIGAPLVLLAALWGIAVLGLGMRQTGLLPGSMHWVVKVVHLALGMIAMGIANVVAVRSRSGPAVPAPSRARRSDTAESSFTTS